MLTQRPSPAARRACTCVPVSILPRHLHGLHAARHRPHLRLHPGQRFCLATFMYRTPHALHRVLGPAGPARHTGVLDAPH
eukprot:362386-Chlamydomonas_euryale.AAC.1